VPTQRIVSAGGPGSGKTTLLRALELGGHTIVADSARSIIQARKDRLLGPRPAPLEFAHAILSRDIRQYGERASRSGLVFFERGIVDALGMLRDVGALSEHELDTFLSTYPYHRHVFLSPPWQAIYAKDAERDQTFAEAERVYGRASAWYRHCGYEVIEVPKVSVAQRCTYVLQVLGAPA